jgi:hypothetical protein
VLWGYAENSIGIIVACVATLRPLFRDLFNLGGASVKQRTPIAIHVRRKNGRMGRSEDDEWVSLEGRKIASSEEHILGNTVKIMTS